MARAGARPYVACQALAVFALGQFVLPFLKRFAEEAERAQDELRRQLGRKPTEREVLDHLGLGRRR